MPTPDAPKNSSFPATRWTLVFEAQRDDAPGSRAALAQLCKTYWYPLYAYARRFGKSHEDAEDLTQSLFARVFNPESFAKFEAREWRGKLRSYLLTSMKNLITGEWRKDQTAKRGGGVVPISLDAEHGDYDANYQAEPHSDETPEVVFERNWAITQLDTAFKRLRAECESSGKLANFEALKDILGSPGERVNFTEIGERLGMTEGNARVTAHRLRGRLRDLLREVISDTVSTDSEVEEELVHIRAVLTR